MCRELFLGFQPFQLFQRRAHFLLTFGIVTFQANQRLNQA